MQHPVWSTHLRCQPADLCRRRSSSHPQLPPLVEPLSHQRLRCCCPHLRRPQRRSQRLSTRRRGPWKTQGAAMSWCGNRDRRAGTNTKAGRIANNGSFVTSPPRSVPGRAAARPARRPAGGSPAPPASWGTASQSAPARPLFLSSDWNPPSIVEHGGVHSSVTAPPTDRPNGQRIFSRRQRRQQPSRLLLRPEPQAPLKLQRPRQPRIARRARHRSRPTRRAAFPGLPPAPGGLHVCRRSRLLPRFFPRRPARTLPPCPRGRNPDCVSTTLLGKAGHRSGVTHLCPRASASRPSAAPPS